MSEPKAEVSFSMGRTLNTGNYESTRFDVSLSLECAKSEMKGTYHQLKKTVEAKIAELEKEHGPD